MKTVKTLASLMLCLALLGGLSLPTSAAAAANTNLCILADKEIVDKGDMVSISVSVSAMTVSSFAGGITFDPNVFECVSIEGTRAERPERIYLLDSSDDWNAASSVSTAVEANRNGTVGFVWTGTSDTSYPGQTFAVVTFKAKAAGSTAIYLFEDSDGMDGKKFDAESNGDKEGTLLFDVTVKKTNVTISASTQTPGYAENVQILVAVDSMTVSTFAAGIAFDPTHLECVSIEGTRAGKTDRIYLQDGYEDWNVAGSVSTVVEANSTGTVGFVWTGTSDASYPSQTFAAVTFKVISDGTSEVFLYEDSAGANGKKYDAKLEDDGAGIHIATAQREISVSFPDATSAVVSISNVKEQIIIAALYDSNGRQLDVAIKEYEAGSTELVLVSHISNEIAAYCKIMTLDLSFCPVSEALVFRR